MKWLGVQRLRLHHLHNRREAVEKKRSDYSVQSCKDIDEKCAVVATYIGNSEVEVQDTMVSMEAENVIGSLHQNVDTTEEYEAQVVQ